MSPSCSAVATGTANDVSLTAHQFAHSNIVNILPECFDSSDILMANLHRNRNGFLRPLIPVINVNISSANGSLMDFYQDIIWSVFRNRNFIYPDSGLGMFFNEGFHFLHNSTSEGLFGFD